MAASSCNSSFPKYTQYSSVKHISNPQLMTTNLKRYMLTPSLTAQEHVINLQDPFSFAIASTTTTERRHITDEITIMMENRSYRMEEARLMFEQIMEEGKSSMENLVMIDSLQRLGLDYYFQEDISAVLKQQYYYYCSSTITNHDGDDDDLLETSLRFRLLRQQGYHVPSDMFQKFITQKGKLGDNDIRGLVELYEASFWSITGESILHEAGQVSAEMLRYLKDHNILANYTLRCPFHRSLPKFYIKNYLNILHGTPIKHYYNDTFTDLVKLEFNINQYMHREEANQVVKWWKQLGLAEELKFARNEPVKWYMWPLAILTDPKFSEERIELTKPISLVYLIDDIFDVYGPIDELILFTETVTRWDIAAAEQLPDYMNKCFMALHEVTNQFGYKVYKTHGYDPTHSLQQTWAKLFKAFLVEAKWFHSSKCPKAEEYLKNGIMSSGVQLVLIHLFFLLGHGLTKRNVDLLDGDNPPIISSVAKILRLCDDLSAMDEKQDEYDGSYVDCYMKEHPESTLHGARERVMEMIKIRGSN